VLDEVINTASARALSQAGAQFCEIGHIARGYDFYIAVFSVADPAAQLQFAGFTVNKPPKAHALHASLYKKMQNHRHRLWSVLQMGRMRATLSHAQVSYRPGGAAPEALTPREGAKLKLTMVFVLDNYDSFTYNLVQYLGELGAEVVVRRNDELSVEEVEALHPDRILLSPGPCTPGEAGILVPLIRYMAGKVPILGVCLGHQAIGEAFGGNVIRARNLMHGKTSAVEHDGKGVFAGLPTPLICTRYHSLIVEEKSLPSDLAVTARTPELSGVAGTVIMGVRHRTLPIEGVQFHPESVLTEGGHQMIRNFLGM
jgi:anthranilate synthase/aminodeoxychorismate synthase-like glutamine amidotransferase